MREIVLITSIAPRNLLNQKQAISSWLEKGFHIISCNTQAEIDLIRKDFPKVEFVEIHRDAQAVLGKPCPYIYDMLQIVKNKSKDICGIINSDIHLRNFSQDMYQYLFKEAQDKVIFMRRHDIDTLEDIETLKATMFLGGIDVFLFHKDLIDWIPNDDLILGQIMWDYWLPIMWAENQIKIKEFINPVIFHIRHSVQWDAGSADLIARELCKQHFSHVKEEDATFFIKDRYWRLMSDTDLQMCYVTEEMKKKKILVQTNDFYFNVREQTHQICTVLGQNESTSEDYDYSISIPYHIIANKAMIDLLVWIVEEYGWNVMQLFVYWRGNKSNTLRLENCNNDLVKKFNLDIAPIQIKSCKYTGSTNHSQMHYCNVYTCSVFTEEDVEKIWNMNMLHGSIYLYPAGYVAQKWVKRFGKIAESVEILGFVDKSQTLQGRTICGLTVYHPRVLNEIMTYDKVMIISNMYADEIFQELKEIIPEEKIIIWNEFDGIRWKENEIILEDKSC